MTFTLLNRTRLGLSGTAGTGTLTINSATPGFQDFATAGMSDGDTTSYLIEDGSPLGMMWEIGIGTFHSSGTFSRDTVTKSSAGGTTKISVTSGGILSATVRAEDLMAVAGSVGSTSPTVVQSSGFGTGFGTGAREVVFTNGVTEGNLIVMVGCSPDNDGNEGFNFSGCDLQYNNHSRTAWKVGWGYKVATTSDANHAPVMFSAGSTAVSGNQMYGVALEIAGADIAALTSSNWANGVFTSSSSSVSATAVANSLDIAFYGGDNGSTVTITDPSTSHINQTFEFAEWLQRTSAGTLSLTGSVSGGGGNGAFVLNIPGV